MGLCQAVQKLASILMCFGWRTHYRVGEIEHIFWNFFECYFILYFSKSLQPLSLFRITKEVPLWSSKSGKICPISHKSPRVMSLTLGNDLRRHLLHDGRLNNENQIHGHSCHLSKMYFFSFIIFDG